MRSTQIPVLAAAAFVCILSASACTPRPAAPSASSSNLDTCVYCHGTEGRVGNLPGTDRLLPSAPPVAPNGTPGAVVGAHQVHLNPPVNGSRRGPIACNECHVVPLDLRHATNPPVNPVEFGSLARAQGASPTYEPLSLGCAAVYCHGNFDFNGVKGKAASVVWEGGVVGCDACHGLPPTGHPPLTGTVTPGTCSQCHPSTVNGDGSINVASGAHINGLAEVSFSCTACHGTAGRTGFQPGTDPNLASAPPIAPIGAPAYAVGAHQPHLNPAVTGSMRGPLACAECHVVPTTPAHATAPPASRVVFGPLATTQGATPTWVATTTGCAATYCHGNFAFNGVTGANATPLWTDAPMGCGSCHGMPPAGHPTLTGTVTAATCAQCHPSTVNANGSINLTGGAHLNGVADVVFDCTSCHGTAGRTGNLPGTDPLLASAPPVAPSGKPSGVVGAHQVHLNPPFNGPLRGPIACNECHVVPPDLQHATNPPANPVQFGTLARAQGATPTYAPLSLGCAAVYCHGNFDFNGVRGKAASVVWDGGVVGCGACHDLPPTGHPALTGTVTPATCSQCHPLTVNPNGSINVNGGGHINGQADVSFDCTACHGTAGRTGFQPGTDPNLASAPPIAPIGAPAYAVGAHQPHLNPAVTGSMRGPLACAECHVVPTTPAHATAPPVSRVVFGPLARTQGATPTWVATTTGCAATYCHGNFAFNGVTGANATPLWTGAPMGCGSCHGMPPAGHPTLTGTVTAATCAQCHPSTVNANGSINLTGGAHLNGVADVVLDCTSCHGTAGRTGIQPGTDPRLDSAPPVAPAGAPGYTVGAHMNHLNPPATGSFRGPVACNECHVVPTNSAHATTPPAQKVVFGTLATARGATPTWTSTTTGCAATYCHGAFNFNGVTGANATPLWTAVGLVCTSCHAMPPAGHPSLSGAVSAATCSQCHPSSVNANGTINLTTGTHLNGAAEVNFSCTACHGTPGRTGFQPGTDPLLAASPPFQTAGHPASAVGAHQFHVNPPSTGAFRSPLLCNECHVVPADNAHATNPPASPVVFGALSRTQGNAPNWNATTLSCSTTYCHGGFNFNGVTGAAATPIWTDTNMACVSCHGLPPTGHPALPGTVTAATCAQCHPSTVNANGTINVASGAHVNGLANVAAGCTACHGTAGRAVPAGNPNALLPAAPPVAPPGSPASVVGAHLLHLTDSTIRAAVNCNECHVVPSNADHAIQFPPVIVFSPGTLATTQGAAPTYNGTTLSCSATYCHGRFTFGGVTGNTGATPAWNANPTSSCTGCHGMPPTGHQALTAPVTGASCAGCHSETVNTDGTIKVAGGKHIDGLAEYSGGHPAGWSDPTQHGYSANLQGLQNCTTCHTSFGAASGVAASSCNTCHTNAGHPNWQNECTFCHGTPGRTGNVTGTDAFLQAAPPVGPQGQTLTSDAMVGAHQKHVNPLASGQKAPPFACTNCHASPLPSGVAHVNGLAVPIPFGGVALTGNVQPTFNPTSLSCSATYCHGNFPGGATTAAPVWTGGPMNCSSCHGLPPGTGEHSRHSGQGIACGSCHSGYSTSVANVTLHVNGAKDVGGPGTNINTWNASTLQCAPACHGGERW